MSTNLFSGIPDQFPALKRDMWSIIFPQSMGISERFQVTASRPKINNSDVAVKYKHSTFYYKGTTTVDPITITFRDVVGPAVMQKLWLWQKEHYDFTTGCGGYPAQYKKNLVLLMEDDCGNAVQKWILYGAFLTNIDGGSLDMNSQNEIAEVSITVRYDYPDLVF